MMFDEHMTQYSGIANSRRGMFCRLTSVLLVMLATTVAQAAEFGAAMNARKPDSANNFSVGSDYLVQVILALLLVVGVIFFISFVAKRFSLLPGASAGPIKILSSLSLGGKDRLLLVQVGEEQLLLGASPGKITKIHTLEEKLVAANEATTVASKTAFESILSSVPRGWPE